MNDKDTIKAMYFPEGNYLGRSLDSYKSTQAKIAASLGVGEQLKASKTLTEARKIVYGKKVKRDTSGSSEFSTKRR